MNTMTAKSFYRFFPTLHFLGATCLSLLIVVAAGKMHLGQWTQMEAVMAALCVGAAPFAVAAWVNFQRGRGVAGVFFVGAAFHLGTPVLMAMLRASAPAMAGGVMLGFVLLLQSGLAWLLCSSLASRPVKGLEGAWKAAASVLCAAWLVILLGAIIVAA